jgi:putative SOS response-associated peptidase YedK
VPVDNFYEWKKTETGKQPYAIALADRHLMALAGLWETWRSPAGERVRSFAIIPTTPNKLGKHAVETILCSFKEILTSDSAYCEM